MRIRIHQGSPPQIRDLPLSMGVIAYTDIRTDARVIREARAAAEAGFLVDLIVPATKDRENPGLPKQITLHRLKANYYKGPQITRLLWAYVAFFIRCLIRTSCLCQDRRFHVIHVHNIPDFLVFATLVPKISGAKVVLDIHDPMPSTYLAKYCRIRRDWIQRLLLLLEKMSAAYADGIITVSEPVKNDVLVRDGLLPDKIIVIKNFADGELFRPTPAAPIGHQIRLIYHGTIAARFGFDTVLTAISRIRYPENLALRIVGRGDDERSLEESIRHHGLEETVVFENRTYPLSQMPSILRDYHLGMVPYGLSKAADYMLPVKLFELLAMGIPSITIPSTAICYYLDSSLYFAYDPRRPESLTDLLNRILADPSLILEKREAILKNRERFLWSGERDRYIGYVRSLVG